MRTKRCHLLSPAGVGPHLIVSFTFKFTEAYFWSLFPSFEALELSDELLKTQVHTMTLSECNATLTEWNKKNKIPALRNGLGSGQYCAYDPQSKSDSCQGDSGGPLQVYRGTSSIPYVLGIVSFGISCGTSLPAVYTRVAFYNEWIAQHVWPELESNTTVS